MSVPLSRRAIDASHPNALTSALEALRSSGREVRDLTGSNPTRAGIPYPDDLLRAMASPAGLHYDPDPQGLWSARTAVAAEFGRRGAIVDPADLMLTASTSEAYSWLFKVLCNPGDHVLVPRPSYPLFEHLARLEGVILDAYDLSYHGRWEVDLGAIASASPAVRAVIVVTPNNPTGSSLTREEFGSITETATARGWAVIADEVFVDYPLEEAGTVRDLAVDAPCLTVSLGGLSKSVGLPQLKLGWMLVGGPRADRHRALRALEIVADSFLSVSTPVQVALPDLLSRGAAVRRSIHERLRTNLSTLREMVAKFPQCEVLRVEGGWSSVIRVPAIRSEEALVLDLLEREQVLVHPGYFFDFRHEAFLVVSLLTPPELLATAMPAALEVATGP